jgi:hypothetical protein
MGGSRYARQSYPNILTKIYDLPIVPRIDYPDIVWQYLNACPYGEKKTRRELLKEHWHKDENLHIFKNGINDTKLVRITGNEPYSSDLDLISDKLMMMDDIKAATLQMSRPLLEICMVARGKKHYPGAESSDKPEQKAGSKSVAPPPEMIKPAP